MYIERLDIYSGLCGFIECYTGWDYIHVDNSDLKKKLTDFFSETLNFIRNFSIYFLNIKFLNIYFESTAAFFDIYKIQNNPCYGLICVPPINSYVEVPNPQ